MVHSVEEYECADTSMKDGKVVAQHNEYSIHSTPSTPLQVDIYLPPLQVDIYQPLYNPYTLKFKSLSSEVLFSLVLN